MGHINTDAQRSHPANSEAFAGLDEEQCCRPGALRVICLETEKAEVGKGNSLARNLEESIEPGGWLKPKFFIHSLVLKSPMAAPIVSTNPFDVIGEDPRALSGTDGDASNEVSNGFDCAFLNGMNILKMNGPIAAGGKNPSKLEVRHACNLLEGIRK